MKSLMLSLSIVLALCVSAADAKPRKPAPATQPAPATPAAEPAKAEPAPVGEAKPLEEVLNSGIKDPNGKHVMVWLHLLIENANAKGVYLHAQFIDAPKHWGVNLKRWDPKLAGLKPGTVIRVTGELHFGTVGGGPSVRYKVREVGGKTYNDHRHWRTDKAIYVKNPKWEIVPPEQAKALLEKKPQSKPAGPAKADAPGEAKGK